MCEENAYKNSLYEVLVFLAPKVWVPTSQVWIKAKDLVEVEEVVLGL